MLPWHSRAAVHVTAFQTHCSTSHPLTFVRHRVASVYVCVALPTVPVCMKFVVLDAATCTVKRWEAFAGNRVVVPGFVDVARSALQPCASLQ